MPYVRISLLKGKSVAFLTALSESVHRALVEAFDVPPDDRFQVIHQCEPHELIFDRHYLGGPRSDDFVLLAVTAGRSRSEEVKKAFYSRLVSLLGTSPGISPRDVMVVIDTTQTIDWSFGNGISAIEMEATR
jgi:phenylpyruvate tautomerase PptA (4-oxalocrotonate tautomerase family)